MTRREMLSTLGTVAGALALGLRTAERKRWETQQDATPHPKCVWQDEEPLHLRFGYSEPRFKTVDMRLYLWDGEGWREEAGSDFRLEKKACVTE